MCNVFLKMNEGLMKKTIGDKYYRVIAAKRNIEDLVNILLVWANGLGHKEHMEIIDVVERLEQCCICGNNLEKDDMYHTFINIDTGKFSIEVPTKYAYIVRKGLEIMNGNHRQYKEKVNVFDLEFDL